MHSTITKPEQLLQLLAVNRELIQRNNRTALETLALLNAERASIFDDDCLLSLELNNSMVQFYFYSGYQKAIDNSLNAITNYGGSDSVFVAWHLWLTGHCNASLGKEDKALYFLNKALDAVCQLTAMEPVLTHEIFHSLAMNSHMNNGAVDITLSYLKQALEAIVNTDDDVRKANCLTGMGNVYLDNELPEKALPNYLRAAGMYEAKSDRQNRAMVYSNIGLCYLNLKDYENAEQYLNLALELQLNASSPEHLTNTYHNLSLLYKEKKHLARAQYFLNKSREILAKTGNKAAIEATKQLQDQIKTLDVETFPLN